RHSTPVASWSSAHRPHAYGLPTVHETPARSFPMPPGRSRRSHRHHAGYSSSPLLPLEVPERALVTLSTTYDPTRLLRFPRIGPEPLDRVPGGPIRNAQLFANFLNRDALRMQCGNTILHLLGNRRAGDPLALGFGPGHARLDPFADERTFKLGQ